VRLLTAWHQWRMRSAAAAHTAAALQAITARTALRLRLRAVQLLHTWRIATVRSTAATAATTAATTAGTAVLDAALRRSRRQQMRRALTHWRAAATAAATAATAAATAATVRQRSVQRAVATATRAQLRLCLHTWALHTAQAAAAEAAAAVERSTLGQGTAAAAVAEQTAADDSQQRVSTLQARVLVSHTASTLLPQVLCILMLTACKVQPPWFLLCSSTTVVFHRFALNTLDQCT
jgi:hypothetical protein